MPWEWNQLVLCLSLSGHLGILLWTCVAIMLPSLYIFIMGHVLHLMVFFRRICFCINFVNRSAPMWKLHFAWMYNLLLLLVLLLCSFGSYLKLFLIWSTIVVLDFLMEFRFEYMWPCWLLIRTINDSFKYQGIVSCFPYSFVPHYYH